MIYRRGVGAPRRRVYCYLGMEYRRLTLALDERTFGSLGVECDFGRRSKESRLDALLV